MIIINLILFLIFFFVLIKSSQYAIRYSSRLSKTFRVSEFIFSFFIVAIISAFPETTISIISAIRGVPEFGLGTLLGSNVADLTLVFGIVALISAKGISVKNQILKKDLFCLALLLLPLIMGLNGHFSRLEGILLVLAGLLFFFTLFMESKMFKKKLKILKGNSVFKNSALLILSLAVLLISSNYTVKFGVDFANDIKIPAVLIGLTIISIGVCLPELIFSIRAIKSKHNGLAFGDILGTVIIDATIVIGIIAIIKPFSFNPVIIYVTGLAMFLGGLLTFLFSRSGNVLSKREGIYLLLFYALYLIIEILVLS